MVTEGYHFFKNHCGRRAVARPWVGRQASGGDRGTWRNRRPVEGLRERIGREPHRTDAEEGFDLWKAQDRRKLEFWQVPMRRIRQKAERSKVVKTCDDEIQSIRGTIVVRGSPPEADIGYLEKRRFA